MPEVVKKEMTRVNIDTLGISELRWTGMGNFSFLQGIFSDSPHIYPTLKVRNSGGKEIPLVQGKEQQLCFAGAAVKRYPTSKVRET